MVGWPWRGHLTLSYQVEEEIGKSARLEAALRVSQRHLAIRGHPGERRDAAVYSKGYNLLLDKVNISYTYIHTHIHKQEILSVFYR